MIAWPKTHTTNIQWPLKASWDKTHNNRLVGIVVAPDSLCGFIKRVSFQMPGGLRQYTLTRSQLKKKGEETERKMIQKRTAQTLDVTPSPPTNKMRSPRRRQFHFLLYANTYRIFWIRMESTPS